MATSATQAAIDAVWRIEAPRLTASLTRIVRDVGWAEDLAQDALVAALEQWPATSIPRNPAAWLMTTAKRRAIDQFRRNARFAAKVTELGHMALVDEAVAGNDPIGFFDDDYGDDLLRLMFVACHPVLSTEARVALTLRLLGGLTTQEIAHAFLLPTPTVAQRLTRAKATLAAANVPFEAPPAAERSVRLASVLEVIYLIFNEGYAASSGQEWMRLELCENALRLGRVLAELVPAVAEVHGLVALMELQSSRVRARRGPGGEPVLLLDQDRGRWDYLLIGRGLVALARAEHLGGALGPYALQAAIAACHARARTPEATDWPRIAALYDALAQVAPSPVVELNRAVALGMAFGPEVGLAHADALGNVPALADYHLWPAVRGDLLAKIGRSAEARRAFEHAATLTRNARERETLLARARACAGHAPDEV